MTLRTRLLGLFTRALLLVLGPTYFAVHSTLHDSRSVGSGQGVLKLGLPSIQTPSPLIVRKSETYSASEP